MAVPSYNLENKEKTKFLVKAIKNYCIIAFFYLLVGYPTTNPGPYQGNSLSYLMLITVSSQNSTRR